MIKIKYFSAMVIGLPLILIFLGKQSFAQNMTATKVRSLKQKISVDASLLHYRGMESGADDITVLTPSLVFKLSDRTTWAITQTMTKLYVVDPGQNQVQAADTVFSYQHVFWKNILGLNWAAKAQATLPVSEYSRDHEVVTKPYVAISWSRGLWDDAIKLSFSPYTRYYVNKYTTTDTESGAIGGEPLRRNDVGAVASLGVSLPRGLSFLSVLQYQENYYENIGKKNRVSVNADSLPLSHNYSFDLQLEAQLSRWWSVVAGYGQADQVERSGGLQLVAYDPVATQVFFGTHYAF